MVKPCLYCGIPNKDIAELCKNCGRPIGYAVPPPPQYQQPYPQPYPQPKDDTGPIIAIIIVVIIVVVVIAVIGVIFLIGLSSSSLSLDADLRYDATEYYYWSGGGGTDVDVWGTIYNHGSSDTAVIVRLEVFIDSTWHYYNVNAGVVPENGHRYFEWSHDYSGIYDEENVNVHYSLSKA